MIEELINPEWPATRLNRYLMRKYKYDLFDFAFSLAIALRKSPPLCDFNIWSLTKPFIADYATVQTERDRLIKMRDKLISGLKRHLSALSRVQNPLFPKEVLPGIRLSNIGSDRSLNFMIRSAYRIDTTLTTEIEVLSAAMKRFTKSKGASSRPHNLTGCLWSLIMQDSRRIHLENIENLLGWFYERLENTSYQKKICSSPALEEISRLLRRHRDELQEDAKKIFRYDYRSERRGQKIFPFSIRFDIDEPRFIKRHSERANIRDCVLFPEMNENG